MDRVLDHEITSTLHHVAAVVGGARSRRRALGAGLLLTCRLEAVGIDGITD